MQGSIQIFYRFVLGVKISTSLIMSCTSFVLYKVRPRISMKIMGLWRYIPVPYVPAWRLSGLWRFIPVPYVPVWRYNQIAFHGFFHLNGKLAVLFVWRRENWYPLELLFTKVYHLFANIHIFYLQNVNIQTLVNFIYMNIYFFLHIIVQARAKGYKSVAHLLMDQLKKQAVQ